MYCIFLLYRIVSLESFLWRWDVDDLLEVCVTWGGRRRRVGGPPWICHSSLLADIPQSVRTIRHFNQPVSQHLATSQIASHILRRVWAVCFAPFSEFHLCTALWPHLPPSLDVTNNNQQSRWLTDTPSPSPSDTACFQYEMSSQVVRHTFQYTRVEGGSNSRNLSWTSL